MRVREECASRRERERGSLAGDSLARTNNEAEAACRLNRL